MTEEFNQFEHALTIAENNLLNVSPRPPVGAVIYKDGKVLGEGVTNKSPGNHAEINALEQCKKTLVSLKNATLFTTLEPCFHKGETGPCVDKIIESGISKIIIGEIDPNPKVNGKSIKKLEQNLYTRDLPDPDILIRTGGRKRLSNFMLWQLAYTEIYFLDKLWPDFNDKDLKKIVKNFKNVKRNFGSI